MKNLIIGSYGAGNLGDEAILEVMLRKLDKSSCAVLSGKPEDTHRRHGVQTYPHIPFGLRSFLRFNWMSSFRALKQTDRVLLGGGGLFTTVDSAKAVYLWAWHILWARLFRKPVILFANSVGPIEGAFNRWITRRALARCQTLIVRDPLSKKELEKLGFKKVHLGFDPVILFAPVQENTGRKKIALNLRPLKRPFDAGALIAALRAANIEPVFIATDELDKELLSTYGSVLYPKDYATLVKVLKECETAVGMRLHFLIAAVLAGSKVYGLSYNLKVAGILEELGLPHVSYPFAKIELPKAKHASRIQEARASAEAMFDLL